MVISRDGNRSTGRYKCKMNEVRRQNERYEYIANSRNIIERRQEYRYKTNEFEHKIDTQKRG